MPYRSFPARRSHRLAHWLRWSVVSLSVLLLLGACELKRPLEPEDNSATIEVSPQEATLVGVGSTMLLQATARTSTGVSSSGLTWTSLRPDVATVTSAGLVTAAGLGTALITVRYRDAADTAILHVTPDAVEPGSPSVTVAPNSATIQGIGQTISLQATARTETGETVPNPTFTWTSLNPGVATVNSAGLVTTAGQGTARITVTYQSAADTATIQVTSASVPPGSASITVSPQEATLQGIGNTILLQATVRSETGATVPSPNLTWTSLHPGIATVTTGGLVTAAGEGTTLITVTYQTLADTATIHVTPGSPPPPPPTGETWNRVLANVTIQGDVVVPDGETWLIGPGVQIAGNLRTVGGTIAMRPGSSLKFLGANPEEYVGGGQTYAPEFARDIGLWIGDQGVLDIRGTPKTTWNRTGSDPTWAPSDEYWITPTDVGDYQPRRWYPGNPVPQVDPRVPAAEVINVTRDIVIEGPAHIHMHSQRPQRIEYVQLRGMGVSRSGGPVLGRYALHLHFSINGSRGTIIRGVGAVNSTGRVFVPHASHGITMTDNVSVNSFAEGLWWDKGDDTNDLLVDRLCVSGVFMPREVSGQTSRHAAVALTSGTNMVIRNSVVSAARENKLSVGFDWPENAGPHPVWGFEEGNVAHNNYGPGVRFWTNGNAAHVVGNTITYRNRQAGVETGAYANAIRYHDVLLLDDQIVHHSSSKSQERDGGPARYERVHVESRDGSALRIVRLTLFNPDDPSNRIEFIDCTLKAAPGYPKVQVGQAGAEPTKNPWRALFRRCGVVPDDFAFPDPIPSAMEGTSIIIEHEDGRKWEIRVENGQKIVLAL